MKSFLKKYLHTVVKVVIDNPSGSKHPNFNAIFPVNYGCLPNTKAPDGEEVDAYVVGVDKPLKEFEGEVIAVIHRLNDDDDKLVVAPKGKNFSDDEIKKLTNFREKYFRSEIIR